MDWKNYIEEASMQLKIRIWAGQGSTVITALELKYMEILKSITLQCNELSLRVPEI